jgi:hydrogenase maturation factor
MDTGKVDREFFASYIAGRLGASRADVHTGPKHGVDFGVVEVGEQALAVATDPISVLPALGYERAGRFAVRFVLADVAVSGLRPSHLAVSLSLPPELDEESFAAVWRGVDDECRDLGVAIITGHTAWYADASLPWVGAGTAFAVGDPAEMVFPDGARPGDVLVATKGPAVETTGLLTTLFPDQVDLPAETLAAAQARLDDTGVVRDALAAHQAGAVSAMHDATEGGLLGALFEMADSAGVRLVVESDAVPVMPGVRETCEQLGIDPWQATTGGTLLLAVAPDDTDALLAALDDRGTPAAVVGHVESGEGVERDGQAQSRPDGDAAWPVYEQLLQQRAAER